MNDDTTRPTGKLVLVQCSAADAGNRRHHLRLKGGIWQLRITLDRGPKFTGKRRVISLRTRDLDAAIAKRDRILSQLRVAGFLTNNVGRWIARAKDRKSFRSSTRARGASGDHRPQLPPAA